MIYAIKDSIRKLYFCGTDFEDNTLWLKKLTVDFNEYETKREAMSAIKYFGFKNCKPVKVEIKEVEEV